MRPPTSEGGHEQRFVRNRMGESTLSPTRLRDDVNGDIQRKGWGGGGGQRVEPGGKGCAIIRSLRGGMHSVVEALSLRIQAEPPNRGRTGREHLYDTHTGKSARV